jgi:putative ABC transport system permease protein
MRWLHAIRARARLLVRRDAEARMDEEIRFHIEMDTERLVREDGLPRHEARRQALIAFGGVERHKEELREGRGLAWLGGLSLDLKLGFRMLTKYPGLTIVGGLAMAFGIWAGAVTFPFVTLIVHPTLPLPGGDRIVQIRNWDVVESEPDPRALHDFLVWREALRSVTDLGAYRDVTRNLIADDGGARPVQAAEITASAFRIAPTPPLLGRVLLASDERAGAPPVVVIGYDVWRTRFAGDPDVVGRTVQLGDVYATVVGVMPDGFAFPVAHELWTPLRAEVLDRATREGPAITVFGRLAPGVTLERAQAELTTLGRQVAADLPGTHEHLQPRVAPYAKMDAEPSGDMLGFVLIELFVVMLLVLVCSNVALLLFARAATRESELVVRSALGASRGRIIAQLFAEAAVLGGVAAAVGLAGAHLALEQWGLKYLEVNMGRLPFWYDLSLSPTTVLYAALLTLLGAAIAGVMPALKVTRGLGARLKQGTAGGGGLRFGGVWTAVIVAQVAITVAFPVVPYVLLQQLVRIRSHDVGFPAEEYLGVTLEMDAADLGTTAAAAPAAQRARFESALETLRRRLETEPAVSGVTFVDRLPGAYHRERRIELDESSPASGEGDGEGSPGLSRATNEVSIASIDPSFFDVLGAPILAGRGFSAADLAPNARAVIVDRDFVDLVLLGRNAVGRRVRFTREQRGGTLSDDAPPWYEIVGVVNELRMDTPQRGRTAGLYLPQASGSAGRLNFIVHVRGDPMSFAPRLRAIATAVDPALRLSEMQRLDQVTSGALWFLGLWLRITLVLTAIALLLSLAGIYAVLSFTVARRTREIGVRVALGANPRRIVAAIFRRPLTQVGLGVVAGTALVAAAVVTGPLAGSDGVLSRGGLSPSQIALLTTHSAVMMGVCLLACIVPTRRALRVEPTEALRAE